MDPQKGVNKREREKYSQVHTMMQFRWRGDGAQVKKPKSQESGPDLLVQGLLI